MKNSTRKNNKLQLVGKYCLLGIFVGVFLSSCGNSWFKKQDESYVQELYKQGKQAADARDFETAIEKFSLALEHNEANYDIRLRLAYAYNGKAGLDAIALYNNLQSSKSTTLNATDSGMSEISKILGVSDEDKQDFLTKVQSQETRNIEIVRSYSEKISILHKGWTTVCRLLPTSAVEAFVNSNANSIRLMNGQDCRNGTSDEKAAASASFAAVLQLLTEGLYLYDTFFDLNGDGKIDLAEDAKKINSDIKTIKNSISTASGSGITTLMTNLNSKMSTLSDIGTKLKSEPIMTGIIDFSLVSVLVQHLSGIPDDLKAKVTSGAGALSEAKDVIDSLISKDTNTGGGASASAQTASQAISQLASKINSLSGAEKAAAEAEFQQACNQFDSIKDIYGLPATTARPAECQ